MIPLDAEIIIEDVDTNSRSAGNTYRAAVRAQSKVVSNSNDKNSEGVTASIYAAITWTDNLGLLNSLDYIEGNVDITEGEMTTSAAEYGDGNHWNKSKKYTIGKKTSFSKTPGMQAFKPQLYYTAYFKDAGYLKVKVTPSLIN